MRLASVLRISALEKPLSIIELDTAIKIVIIPKMPNSAGLSKRAKTKPTKKVIPWLAILSTKLQLTPCMAFFFKDPSPTTYSIDTVSLFIYSHTSPHNTAYKHPR